jgi:hypothetical protein
MPIEYKDFYGQVSGHLHVVPDTSSSAPWVQSYNIPSLVGTDTDGYLDADISTYFILWSAWISFSDIPDTGYKFKGALPKFNYGCYDCTFDGSVQFSGYLNYQSQLLQRGKYCYADVSTPYPNTGRASSSYSEVGYLYVVDDALSSSISADNIDNISLHFEVVDIDCRLDLNYCVVPSNQDPTIVTFIRI